MSYIIIDPAGSFAFHSEPATLDVVDRIVGVEGYGRVDLDREPGVVAWMNDCAYMFPERYRRNVVGSGVLATMGAVRRPYAGPLVLTDYEYGGEWGGPEVELTTKQRAYAHAVFQCVSAVALGGPTVRKPREDAPAEWGDWAAVMALYLTFAETYPDPLTVFDSTLLGGAR